MKNGLNDLSTMLFEMSERLMDDSGDLNLDKEIQRAEALVDVSNQIIGIGTLQLKAIQTSEEFNLNSKDMPVLLQKKEQVKIGGPANGNI